MSSVLGCGLKSLNKCNVRYRDGIDFLQRYRLLFLSFFICSPLFASAHTEADELKQLLELLNQQTTLATQTQLNSDYVPGMLSIMTGEEMRRRGFATLWDAIAYLPGVQKDVDSTGKRKLIVRGIGKSSETLKIKIQLNGVSLNQSISGATATVFDTPVTQIQKIEFVRGPGSAIHGEYALMGVLNVVTVKQGKAVSVGVDSNHSENLNAVYQVGAQSDPLHGSFNIALSQSDGEDILVSDDKTSAGVTGYAPGQINNKTDSISAIFDVTLSGFDLSLQYQQSNRGDYYGVQDYLPPPIRQTVISETVYALQVQRAFQLTEKLSGQFSMSEMVHATEKNSLFLGVAPIYGGLTGEDDIVSDVDQEERRTTFAINLQYELFAHTLFTELAASRIAVENTRQYINLDPVTLLPDSTLNEFPSPVSEGDERAINSLVFQDEYAINDDITLTAGLRYDDVNNEYNNVSPRLAMVWILSSSNILKFQYSEAFRPPSLREKGGSTGPSISPETNQTSELSYIRNSTDTVIKNTIYYSEIEDYISFSETTPFGYRNVGGAQLTGYELELRHEISPRLTLGANLSLQHSEDTATGKALYGSTPVILNLSTDFRIAPDKALNIQLKSTSEQFRENAENRGDLGAMNQVDITLTRNKLFNKEGLNLRTGVRNLFQEKIKYLAPMDTYAEDYLINEDAIFWLELKYNWQ